MQSKIITEDFSQIAGDIKDIAAHLAGKTLLITGGAGFLGNYFIGVIDYLNAYVLSTPCKVISLDNFITGVKYSVDESPYFTAIKHNIKEPIWIQDELDYIIHAAGIASPRFYRKYKLETIDVATIGTRNVLELARDKNVKSMLFFSSSEVYGDPDPRFVPTPETYNGNVSCIGPRANYDESKRLGETLCITYHEAYGVPVKIVRPFNVYGPGMRTDDYRVIPNFAANAFAKRPIPLYGDGKSTRTFCYISDAITGFFKVLLSDENGEVFNVGNDNDEITMEDLAHIVVDLFRHDVPIQKKQGPNDAYVSGDPKRRCPNIEKIRTRLLFNPKISLRDGVARFIRWVEETRQIQHEFG